MRRRGPRPWVSEAAWSWCCSSASGRAYSVVVIWGASRGTAQALTVLASAVGPVLLAWCVAWTGSYDAMFRILAGIVALVAGAALVIRMPASGQGEP